MDRRMMMMMMTVVDVDNGKSLCHVSTTVAVV